ncbi:MerR family transcriptional regulator [Kineococcus radiotolerans]|uniref:Transcriptional regulator, MerR family n=1 Tax=Kineococcus radiotolerans (strain ATCC BAA-149 / DSM 14245 / SRS30216) TaxID=266940 RepID=A6W9L4_KINRD|nr:MerR family transcriptional regulator [Kineococcus radiotolerans]ABS03503.1 putative transcriptional regulator, MerR family [Kineococcus radiotolerans SRS30216 = ATCC BAA-149]
MFSIGEFATIARVSVRVLRHYDALGLLPPAAVDPATGYRSYSAAQLARLNRVLALKDLGLTLQQVRAVLDEEVGVQELHGMLRLRRAELTEQVAADTARLRAVEVRLQVIEEEGTMGTQDVIVKDTDPVRVAELSAVAASFEPDHIGPVIQPLYGELYRRLAQAGIQSAGPGVAWYEHVDGGDGEEGEAVRVHAGVVVAAQEQARGGVQVTDRPGVRAATIVHHGPMDGVDATWQVLARWVADSGHRPLGLGGEVYLDYCPEDPADGVTELQIPIAPAAGDRQDRT